DMGDGGAAGGGEVSPGFARRHPADAAAAPAHFGGADSGLSPAAGGGRVLAGRPGLRLGHALEPGGLRSAGRCRWPLARRLLVRASTSQPACSPAPSQVRLISILERSTS